MVAAAESSASFVPELVPARMLNEYTYCPRLAYLEWVQGEFEHNADTLDGRFSHRRADRPDQRSVPDPDAAADGDEPAETIHARSVMLSAPGEGLVARIDILETDGTDATPVDYKRGVAPDLPEGAYEPERVQLCAQGLILREAGYRCERGVIYFVGSRRRVTIEFDDALMTRTRQLLAELRELGRSGRMPLPLVDSPKCPRCSLVGICLPDETRWLLESRPGDADDGGRIRRLLPARDDAQPLYVQMQGGQVGKAGERLVVKLKGETVSECRIHDVSQVNVFGNVQVTTQALHELLARQVPVCYFSYGGWFHGWSAGLSHKNIELRIAQFATAANPDASLALARSFTAGKIRNGRTILRRNLEADPDRVLDRLNELAQQAEQAGSAESLLGLEGTAARLYFGGFARLLKGGEAFRFDDRNRRPPRDPINAVLSYLYAMLAKDLTITVQSVGFEPMLGFYHRPRYGRPALALDLAEEFRPLIAESTALTLINGGELDAAHFVQRAGACSLIETGRKIVIGAYERRIDQLITHPVFGYRISYRRVFEVQARLLARTLSGELPAYPNFLTR